MRTGGEKLGFERVLKCVSHTDYEVGQSLDWKRKILKCITQILDNIQKLAQIIIFLITIRSSSVRDGHTDYIVVQLVSLPPTREPHPLQSGCRIAYWSSPLGYHPQLVWQFLCMRLSSARLVSQKPGSDTGTSTMASHQHLNFHSWLQLQEIQIVTLDRMK